MATPLVATKIELAFGANLTADPATWVYTDLSTRGLGSVSVTFGRADEATLTQPTRCTFRLANTDGALTPRFPTSPYYPNVRRQTPARISLNPGTGYVQRFQGYIDSITPVWPSGNSTVAEVSVVASGILRRLGQGNTPLRSPLTRATAGQSSPTYAVGGVVTPPLYFWPFEDNSKATSAAEFFGNAPIIPVGPVTWAADPRLIGSAPLPTVRNGFSFNQAIPPYAATGAFLVQAFIAIPATPATKITLLEWGGTGTAVTWRLTLTAALLFNMEAYNSAGTELLGSAGVTLTSQFVGTPAQILGEAAQNGANLDWQFAIFLPGATGAAAGNSGTLATTTAPAVTRISFTAGSDLNNAAFGQLSLFVSPTTISGLAAVSQTVSDSADGWASSNEMTDTRIKRLCSEQGVAVTIAGTPDTVMGPQSIAKFVDLVREGETADIGILYDGAGPGLTYLARTSRYNQNAALTLDCNRYQVKLPFAPVEDDLRVRNDWTLSRPGGTSARFADSTHIAANGVYDTSGTANVRNDSDLAPRAAWLVHRDTSDEMRIPTLTFDPLHSPEMQTAWFSLTLGQRITATNLPSQYPFGSTDQILEGYTETWDSVTWSVTMNLSPYRPWEVFTIQDARLGRIDTDGSTLAGGPYSSSAASFSVASSGGLWDTGSTPFDVECEGEQITVTSVTGSSSPQTFTVTRSVNGVVKGHSTGAVVKLWRPGVLPL